MAATTGAGNTRYAGHPVRYYLWNMGHTWSNAQVKASYRDARPDSNGGARRYAPDNTLQEVLT